MRVRRHLRLGVLRLGVLRLGVLRLGVLLLGVLRLGVLLLGAAAGAARAAAGPERPMGVVELAHNARLDDQEVGKGNNIIFPGDQFVTGEDGELRLRVDTSQVQVGASSRVGFLADSCPTGLKVIGGFLRFSEPVNGGVAFATPAGVVRGVEGQAASGLIVIRDANALEISAYDQNLILDNDGELHVIPAGQSYRVGVQDAAQDPPASSSMPRPLKGFPTPRRKLVLYTIAGVVAVFANLEIWDQDSESPYKPKPKN